MTLSIDPLSPLIFNCVMDELARTLPTSIGVMVNDALCNVIFFADDLILVSSSKAGMVTLLNRLQVFLKERGLLVNAKKCAALVLTKLGKQKKLINDTTYKFRFDNAEIPSITSSNFLTYLGVPYSPKGKERPSCEPLQRDLEKLAKAPLKPYQKIVILRDFVLPKYLHVFTMSHFCMQDLRTVDSETKSFCRRFLRLPHYSPEGFFFTKARDGGLGLCSFRTNIPLYYISRVENLQKSTSPVIKALLGTTYVWSSLNRALSLIQGFGQSKEAVRKYWQERLYNSVYGMGLSQGANSTISNAVLMNYQRARSSKALCDWLKLRINILPCRGAPAHQGHNLCRACNIKVESLSHISNGCPLSKTKMIERHDKFVSLLRSSTKKEGLEIAVEPRIVDHLNNIHKPDLSIICPTEVVICDVACPWETPRSLKDTYRHKVATYDRPEFREAAQVIWPGKTLRFTAFVVSARGLWCDLNTEICEILELGIGFRKLCSQIALEQTTRIYKSFMAAIHF